MGASAVPSLHGTDLLELAGDRLGRKPLRRYGVWLVEWYPARLGLIGLLERDLANELVDADRASRCSARSDGAWAVPA